jgi:alkanesulfonate monooxygenase SsuD/methylene tetrahydromethanopterin reductase-like flavin-dependent oxidoreductase (luciferase family)
MPALAIGKTVPIRGTPKMVAGKREELHFKSGANGRFILAEGLEVPGTLRDFVEYVVPELPRRGLTKKAYTGATLRDNLP